MGEESLFNILDADQFFYEHLVVHSDWSAEIQWAVLIIQGLTMQLRRADSLYLQRLLIRGYAKRQQNGRQSWSNSE